MKKRIKINGFIIFFAFLLIIAFPKIFLRGGRSDFLDEAAEVFGIIFILLGQVLRVCARGFKSEHSQSGHVLLKDGPYALVRNPMYLGILFIGLGILLALFQWWVLIPFLLIFTLRYIALLLQEERQLTAAFGQEYITYCRQVPWLLPSIKAFYKYDLGVYLPLKLAWFKREIIPMLIVLSVAFFIQAVQDAYAQGLIGFCLELAVLAVIIILFIMLVMYLCKKTK